MYYKILGTLTSEQLEELRSQVDKTQTQWAQHCLWDYTPELEPLVSQLIGDQPCEILRVLEGRASVKLFYTRKFSSSPIHKDGLRARSALNICVDSNPGDWVRWWSDDLLTRPDVSEDTLTFGQGQRHSRNLRTPLVSTVEGWQAEYRPQPGEVYVINTDAYHTYYCAGPHPRRVIQTKFEGWPTYDQLLDQLDPSQFRFSVYQQP